MSSIVKIYVADANGPCMNTFDDLNHLAARDFSRRRGQNIWRSNNLTTLRRRDRHDRLLQLRCGAAQAAETNANARIMHCTTTPAAACSRLNRSSGQKPTARGTRSVSQLANRLTKRGADSSSPRMSANEIALATRLEQLAMERDVCANAAGPGGGSLK